MADYAISNVPRRVVYAASGVGPYAFTFEILVNTDVAVYKDDALLTLTTDYTVSIASNGTGSITLTASPTGATQIAIVGSRAIQRTSDFVTGGDFFANTVNDELDSLTIFAQQNAEGLERALTAPQTDPLNIDMTLPRASVRANKTLAFDSNGNPIIGEVIGDNRGEWAAGTAYNKRDIAKDPVDGNVYYANEAHTSSGTAPISANADAGKWTILVDNASAQEAADDAETAATAAAASASAASTSATNAASSASAASTSASGAATSATNAASSASAASSSATTASTAATNAGNSATAAATSATNASNSATAAATSATNSSNSATSASTSASNASTSATNAATSASTATTQASNAATSATNAASSATAAASSASAAESARDQTLAAYDSFDDRYLGSKTSDPALDNDGNALVAGALYFNSVSEVMKLYTGSAWVAAYVQGVASSIGFTPAGSIAATDVQAAIEELDSEKFDSSDLGVSVQAYDADTAKTDVVQSFTAAQRGAITALTDGATITPDFAVANNFSVTLGGNRTLANPTNLTAGQSGVIVITQDGTGSRTLAYDSAWKFATGTAPTLTTTANAVDVLAYYVESGSRITARLVGDVK
jgi:hypothetical protein